MMLEKVYFKERVCGRSAQKNVQWCTVFCACRNPVIRINVRGLMMGEKQELENRKEIGKSEVPSSLSELHLASGRLENQKSVISQLNVRKIVQVLWQAYEELLFLDLHQAFQALHMPVGSSLRASQLLSALNQDIHARL